MIPLRSFPILFMLLWQSGISWSEVPDARLDSTGNTAPKGSIEQARQLILEENFSDAEKLLKEICLKEAEKEAVIRAACDLVDGLSAGRNPQAGHPRLIFGLEGYSRYHH